MNISDGTSRGGLQVIRPSGNDCALASIVACQKKYSLSHPQISSIRKGDVSLSCDFVDCTIVSDIAYLALTTISRFKLLFMIKAFVAEKVIAHDFVVTLPSSSQLRPETCTCIANQAETATIRSFCKAQLRTTSTLRIELPLHYKSQMLLPCLSDCSLCQHRHSHCCRCRCCCRRLRCSHYRDLKHLEHENLGIC